MEKETMGTVVSAAKQWWLKVNTTPVRMHPLDGAVFPHIIKVEYEAEGQLFSKRKWISAGAPVPAVGSEVLVIYCEGKPKKAKIV